MLVAHIQECGAAWWRPEIEVRGTRTRVLVEQTGAVDTTRLGRRVERLTTEELWAIDDALRALLALRQGEHHARSSTDAGRKHR